MACAGGVCAVCVFALGRDHAWIGVHLCEFHMRYVHVEAAWKGLARAWVKAIGSTVCRCGFAGPVLADLAARHLTQSSLPFAVGKINHIGGHAFAGNLAVYDIEVRAHARCARVCTGTVCGDGTARPAAAHLPCRPSRWYGWPCTVCRRWTGSATSRPPISLVTWIGGGTTVPSSAGDAVGAFRRSS